MSTYSSTSESPNAEKVSALIIINLVRFRTVKKGNVNIRFELCFRKIFILKLSSCGSLFKIIENLPKSILS
jgi:hypothetical protein